jgi:hypothetical protein
MARKEVKFKEAIVKDNIDESEDEEDFSEDIFDGLEALN